MKIKSTRSLLARIRVELTRKGVSKELVEEAVIEATRDRNKPVVVNHKTIRRIQKVCKRLGDKAVVSVTPAGLRVMTLAGYKSMVEGAKKAQAQNKERERRRKEAISTGPLGRKP